MIPVREQQGDQSKVVLSEVLRMTKSKKLGENDAGHSEEEGYFINKLNLESFILQRPNLNIFLELPEGLLS